MTAVPIFYKSAAPLRDHAPIVGRDAEFMRFLDERRRRAAGERPQ